jgi:hypothetical protein
MKTLKVIVVLCIGLGFIFNNANSQPVRTEMNVRIGFFIPCVNEIIEGWIIAERTVWPKVKEDSQPPFHKLQLKYDDVVLIGRVSKEEYVLNFISNSTWSVEGADVTHFVRQVLVRKDGKLIAMLPLLVHKTITPDGDVVVEINDLDVRCF